MLIKTKKNLPKKDQKDTSKQKILETTISQIEKSYGKGSVMRMGTNGSIEKIDSIPTGSIALDLGLGIGGVPSGGAMGMQILYSLIYFKILVILSFNKF